MKSGRKQRRQGPELRTRLTAVELAYLLSTTDPQRRSLARPALGLTEEQQSEVALQAGFGSLLLRGFLLPADGQIVLAPAVAAVARGLGEPDVTIQVGLVSEAVTDGTVLVGAGPIRLLVSPRVFRCYDVTGLDPIVELREPLAVLVHTFLTDNRPGVASVRIDRPAAEPVYLTLLVTAAGSLTFATGRDADTDLTTDAQADRDWSVTLDAALGLTRSDS
jgi:hypothetical protein